MNKLLVLSSFIIISNSYAVELQECMPHNVRQAINALEYIRQENIMTAKKLIALSEETHDALERSSLSKSIDILIQACIYIAERIEYFQNNFVSCMIGRHELEQEVEIAEEVSRIDRD